MTIAQRPARSSPPRPQPFPGSEQSVDGAFGAFRFGCPLLWKAPCLRGAPSALAARLPPELYARRKTGIPLFIREQIAFQRALASQSEPPCPESRKSPTLLTIPRPCS